MMDLIKVKKMMEMISLESKGEYGILLGVTAKNKEQDRDGITAIVTSNLGIFEIATVIVAMIIKYPQILPIMTELINISQSQIQVIDLEQN